MTVMASSRPKAPEYSLEVINKSGSTWDFCLFQNDPKIGNPHVLSIAWLTKTMAESTSGTFTWPNDWDFIWSQTGTLSPGVTVTTSQNWPADPSLVDVWATEGTPGDQVAFQHNPDQGFYTFARGTGPTQPQQGTLYVHQDPSIPKNDAAVGLGISGNPVYVVQAQPNVIAEFTPHPVYYLSFGTFTQTAVLDVTQVSNPLKIDYPANVYRRTAILNPDNTWTLKQPDRPKEPARV